MKFNLQFMSKRLAVALCLAVCAQISLRAQGTAFTYQGRLDSSGLPANGSYDVAFTLYATNTAGFAVAGPVTNTAVGVTNGLFTTLVNFGPGIFTGTNYWLELAVSTNGANVFSTLAPRQQLTPVPYAIFANSANNLLGTLPASQLTGTIPAADIGGSYGNPVNFSNALNSFDGTFVGSGSGLSDVWHTGGNSGTMPALNYLGTADNQPLIIKVNAGEAFRFEPTTNTPNVVGGYSGNSVQPGLYGVTIGGGGTADYGGVPNVVNSNGLFATIGGGNNNNITGYGGTIAGGLGNTIGAYAAFVGAGQYNNAQSTESVIGGGYANYVAANSDQSVIGGGYANNVAANSYQSIVGGGNENSVGTNSSQATVAGGLLNSVGANSSQATVAGGAFNSVGANSFQATIAGGAFDYIQSSSVYATIGGGAYNSVQTNSPSTTVGGGYNNTIAYYNDSATIGGGAYNSISNNADHATIAGGLGNAIQPYANDSAIVGGYFNIIQSSVSFIGGGIGNLIQSNSYYSGIAGGANNQILTNAIYSSIGGGGQNQAGGNFSTVPGGVGNLAGGIGSFAAGSHAQAVHNGAFVLADSGAGSFSSTASNQLSARFTGGIVFATGGAGVTLDSQPLLTGSYPGAVSLANSSNLFSGTFTNSSFSGNGGGLTNLQISSVGPAGTFSLMPYYFSAAQTVPVGLGPRFLAVADLNGDGKPDLITANYFNGTMTLLTNNGGGVLVSNTALPTGPHPYAVVAVTNFNSHGGMALVSANSGTNTLTIWTNNGIAAFKLYGTVVVSDATNFPKAVVTMDVNGDGKPDLVCLNSSSYEQDTLTVLTNNGNGFGSNTLIHPASFRGGTALQAADVNGDGLMDLVFIDPLYSAYSVLTNNGNGGFGMFYANTSYFNPTDGDLLYTLSAIAVADVNGDGKPDLLFGTSGYLNVTNFVSASENDLVVLTNNGGGFGISGIYNVAATNGGNTITCCTVADINGDGKPDAVLGNSSGTLTVMINNNSGGFSYNATEYVGNNPLFVAAADLNGDGKPDLASANYGDNTISVLLSAPLQSTLTVTDIVSMTNGLNHFSGSFGGTFSGAVNGVFTGDGTGLTNVNAATLNGLPASAFAPASGSTNYIQNQSSTPQVASFNISSNATVGNNATIRGLLISGTGTGTSDFPTPSGVIVRRINSYSSASGEIVANTDTLSLQRDGSNGGFLVFVPINAGNVTIACMGIDNTGAQKNFYAGVANNPGTGTTVPIYTDSQNIVHFECTFGITYASDHHLTQVTLSRYANGTTLDNFWSGTMISTYNQ